MARLSFGQVILSALALLARADHGAAAMPIRRRENQCTQYKQGKADVTASENPRRPLIKEQVVQQPAHERLPRWILTRPPAQLVFPDRQGAVESEDRFQGDIQNGRAMGQSKPAVADPA